MTDRSAYELDPYLTRLTTEIDSVGESDGRPYAVPRDTILYPEGGGQPADRGRLGGIAVIDVQRAEDGIRHYLESPVEAGPAQLELDWKRRYDHMQQHTAQHLLSAIALDRFGWATTSFHLGARQCDIELDVPTIDPEAVTELEALVMTEVRAARPVTARRVSEEAYRELDIRTRGLPESHHGDVRLVEIEVIDVTTCGGTHLRSTAEIESMRLGPTESLRGGVRLYWLAGARVRRRLAELERRNTELRLLFETSGDELVATAADKLEALKTMRRSLKRSSEELAEMRAAALARAPTRLVEAHFEDADGGLLQSLARGIVTRAPDKIVLVTAAGEKGLFFCIAAGASSGVELSQTGREVAELLDGRGGGSGAFFQGKAGSMARRAEAVARLLALV